MPDDAIESLRSIPLFSNLTDDRLRSVAALATEVRHPPGHVILREGMPAHGFHLLVDGEVDVYSGGHARRTLGKGAFFGELALIDEGTRSASVTASTAVTMLAIGGDEFRTLVREDAELGFQLLVYLAGLIRDAERREGRTA